MIVIVETVNESIGKHSPNDSSIKGINRINLELSDIKGQYHHEGYQKIQHLI